MTTARAALPLLLLALAACGGGGDTGQEPTGTVAAAGSADAQTATVVGNARLEFVPSRVTAEPGTLRLTMQVEGGVPHDLAFVDDAVGDRIETTSGSGTGTYRFADAGTYRFVCTLHPGMEGEVVVE